MPWRQVISHFDGEKADLVVCDGAPDGNPLLLALPSYPDRLLSTMAMCCAEFGNAPAPRMPCLDTGAQHWTLHVTCVADNLVVVTVGKQCPCWV